MAHPYHHALSSAKRFGGGVDDYVRLHQWFDATKAHIADARHRLLRHHSFGIFIAEQKFGATRRTPSGKVIPPRPVAKQHVQEDFSFIPSVAQCFAGLEVQPWMLSNYGEDAPTLHAKHSAEEFGFCPINYLAVHEFLESSRLHLPDPPHRVLLHTTLGIQTVEEVFGPELSTQDGNVPTHLITEEHIRSDLGFILAVEEALDSLPLEPWIYRGAQALTKKLGRKVPTRTYTY
jgi:hypothetical protein